jgi:hypothetical protein
MLLAPVRIITSSAVELLMSDTTTIRAKIVDAMAYWEDAASDYVFFDLPDRIWSHTAKVPADWIVNRQFRQDKMMELVTILYGETYFSEVGATMRRIKRIDVEVLDEGEETSNVSGAVSGPGD